ncbi:MAG: glyoxalase [Kangiellaceae bacterium]|jgi:predicted enzyme related to lactoylglutathione lyase|nr:glyoxalase [Kangiellaceae bacterium]
MSRHEKINYVEFATKDLEATKAFFTQVFGWTFEDYGSDYSAFTGQGLDGGFYRDNLASTTKKGGALIVFYSLRLEITKKKIEEAGGVICKPVFSFPGGRRFHFKEPSGNEFAVWSDEPAS